MRKTEQKRKIRTKPAPPLWIISRSTNLDIEVYSVTAMTSEASTKIERMAVIKNMNIWKGEMIYLK